MQDQKIDLLTHSLPARLGNYARVLAGIEILTEIDAFLIAGLIDRETLAGTSKYLDKPGPAGRGDGGHGHGLAQIDDRFHPSFLGAHDGAGVPLWALPEFNILYGVARVLVPNLHALAGSVPAAVASYNAGLSRVRGALHSIALPGNDADVLALVDPLTQGGNYASDVLQRRDNFKAAALAAGYLL